MFFLVAQKSSSLPYIYITLRTVYIRSICPFVKLKIVLSITVFAYPFLVLICFLFLFCAKYIYM